MVDVIDFLERMGQDSELRHAAETILEQAMRDVQLDSSQERAALMSGSRAEIEAAVGAQSNVCCIVNAPLPEGDDDTDGLRPQQVMPRQKVA